MLLMMVGWLVVVVQRLIERIRNFIAKHCRSIYSLIFSVV